MSWCKLVVELIHNLTPIGRLPLRFSERCRLNKMNNRSLFLTSNCCLDLDLDQWTCAPFVCNLTSYHFIFISISQVCSHLFVFIFVFIDLSTLLLFSLTACNKRYSCYICLICCVCAYARTLVLGQCCRLWRDSWLCPWCMENMERGKSLLNAIILLFNAVSSFVVFSTKPIFVIGFQDIWTKTGLHSCTVFNRLSDAIPLCALCIRWLLPPVTLRMSNKKWSLKYLQIYLKLFASCMVW